MILLAGIPSEAPMALVIDALDAIGAAYRVFDQRRVQECGIAVASAGNEEGGALHGRLTLTGESIALEEISAAYLRLMDDRLLPDIVAAGAASIEGAHSRRLHEDLLWWADVAPGRIVNRPADMGSNQSKPYQAHRIRAAGFAVPDTLITNDPAAARAFIEEAWAEKSDTIYKSISGVRSVVERVRPDDLARLDRIRWCPVQFQRHVRGVDVRVHTIGARVFAAAIESGATDYRYAMRQVGEAARIAAMELEPAIAARCIELAGDLRLPLAGIDLRRQDDGSFVCFEVNPSPAFSFYEERTGLPIALAIARYLAGEDG
jgi:hypothetical protein